MASLRALSRMVGVLCLVASLGCGAVVPRDRPAAPLLVMISVDGLRPDYVTAADAHGAKVPNLRAAFLVVGPGVPAGKNLGLIDMRDVAPTLAREAELSLPSADGKALLN
jgi:hypothetical protein